MASVKNLYGGVTCLLWLVSLGTPSGEMLVCQTWFQPHGSPPCLKGEWFPQHRRVTPPHTFCVTQSNKITELMDSGREGSEMGQIKESKHPEEHLKL